MKWFDRPAFNLIELGYVLTCAGLWLAWPGLSWLPLLIVCVPWLLRLTVRRFPVVRTPFDLPLFIFLLTAGIGVWAAYDRGRAWEKFWMLVACVLLFYALVRQEVRGLWGFVGFLSATGALLAVYFLLTNDWTTQQAKLPLISQFGVWWMAVRPSLSTPSIHPNNAASLIAIILPFNIAVLLAAWQRRKIFLVILFLAIAGLSVMGLLLTASRGAMLSLAVILGVSFLWVLSGFLAQSVHWSRRTIFILLLLPLCILGIGLAWMFPGGPVRLLDSLPGPASASSRAEIAHSTLQLAADFPFTGGGLRAFPGLYSQYILVIPFFFIEYSHNFFLEVALAQGLLGLLALVVILLGSARMLVQILKTRPGWLAWATVASLAVMCLHGLVTDAVYGDRGSPFVFIHAGIAYALFQPLSRRSLNQRLPVRERGVWKLAVAGGSLLLLFALLVGFRRPLLASWYANLGAVEMARIELADFPSGEWDTGGHVASLAQAEALFIRALEYWPENRTANHRLGIIASMRRDFSLAAAYLEAAYRVSPDHRGIQKVLGYQYAWLGQFERAAELLKQIPEAGQEMQVYVWWWNVQGRSDLSKNAENAATYLRIGSR